MKIKSSILIFSVMLFAACSSNKTSDPIEAAENSNEMKNDSASSGADDNDAKFLVEAASGGMMEVDLGEAAKSKAQHAEVKRFGDMMVRDHTKANEELKTLAASKNITIPPAMGEDQQKMKSQLMEKSGAEFDKDYMDMMVSDHKDDIAAFEKASTDAKDADIRNFAAKTLPVLKTHLDSAIVVQDDVSKKGK